jgi:hypothetical protein
MEKITIEFSHNMWEVRQGDKYAELAWDEMIGLVASLTMPEHCPCKQWMKTKEEHERWEQSLRNININK